MQTITNIYNWGQDIQKKAIEAVSGFFNNVINWFKQLPRKYMELVSTDSYQYS